jgi:hypothetical protein
MSNQYPGGIISKTPVVPSGPYETDSASGIWTLDQQAYWAKLGQWPTAGNIASIVATGGSVTDYNGYRVHRFTTSNDFVITSAPVGATFELFIIAGGGGGGAGSSSGPAGGAGGAYWNTAFTCPTAGTYPIVIGAGGAGVNNNTAADGGVGGNSSAFSLTLVGGGSQNKFGDWSQITGNQGTWGNGRTAADGGSGSGVANGVAIANHPKWGDTTNKGRSVYNSTGAFSGSDQTNYYGYAGGLSFSNGGGGGGGLNANGDDAVTSTSGGNGGAGLSFNWVGTTEWMGGGGGGGVGLGGSPGTGGSGVGGNGGANTVTGTNGATNTGSGAGGSGGGQGGTGGSGVCIIRYAI